MTHLVDAIRNMWRWFYYSITAVGMICIGSVITLTLLIYSEMGSRVADGISKNALLSLRPGMSEKEIIKLIGEPLCMKRASSKQMPSKKLMEGGVWVWVYGEPSPIWPGGGFEISVIFQDKHMLRSYVERYDLGVYKCDSEECPVIWDPEQFSRLR